MVYLHTGPMGAIVRAFLSLGQGEPLPRSGIAREINLLSCASCLSSRTNSRALGKTQADEGLTTADEAGYVVLRQPAAAAGEPVQDRRSFLVWPSLGPFLTLDHH